MATEDSKIENEIKGIRWKFASENIDDDLHTDILFLSTSAGSMKEVAGVSYSHCLLAYDGHKGRFYYPDNEAREINQALLDKLKGDLSWGESVNKNIIIKSVELENVWEPYRNILDFSRIPLEVIIGLYNRQLVKHCELYQYAWIPEILQDPEYGIEGYIEEIGKKYDESFTRKRVLSLAPGIYNHTVYYKHDSAVLGIIETILSKKDFVNLFAEPVKYIRTSLPYEINDKIRHLVGRYGYLGYHGYDERRPYDFNYYLQLIKNYLDNPDELISLRHRISSSAPNSSIWEKMTFDEKRLLSIYHNWGVTKARRRLSQLKNFYFLDKLIDEMAYRNRVPEDFIRFMTPEEVNILCRSGKLPYGVEKRKTSCCCFLSNHNTYILEGRKECDLIREESPRIVSPIILHGNIACEGYQKGKAILITRKSDIFLDNGTDGQILVVREADPDIFCVFDKISAIVTDQGGITCHIASLARDYGIPCIVGTRYATSCISQGDSVEVDAFRGVIKVRKQ